jgi:hypothetical protein
MARPLGRSERFQDGPDTHWHSIGALPGEVRSRWRDGLVAPLLGIGLLWSVRGSLTPSPPSVLGSARATLMLAWFEHRRSVPSAVCSGGRHQLQEVRRRR